MSVPVSYLTVILIWSTTPLAIQWSDDGSGYLFGVSSRMVLGALLAYVILRAMRLSLPMHRKAVLTYTASGGAIYGAMMCVYWAAQFIPSGWISVIFGATPIVTGLMAMLWLGERTLTFNKVIGMAAGLLGLMFIFGTAIELGPMVVSGIAVMLLSVFMHSFSAVWIKRIDAGLHGLSVATGGLLFSLPLYLLTWFIQGESLPQAVTLRAGLAIVYLAVFGSVFGFALYYYVLRVTGPTRVAMITLITPITALLLGHLLNAEPVHVSVYLGAGLILLGLAFYEWGGRLFSRVRA